MHIKFLLTIFQLQEIERECEIQMCSFSAHFMTCLSNKID